METDKTVTDTRIAPIINCEYLEFLRFQLHCRYTYMKTFAFEFYFIIILFDILIRKSAWQAFGAQKQKSLRPTNSSI